MTGLKPQPLPPFGVAIDLSRVPEPGSPEAEELRSLYAQDGFLVIRGLRLSHDEQIAFCRIFGPVNESPFENFLVSNIDKAGHLGKRELYWHNDVPFLPSPYMAACLHALKVGPDAVGTRFVSGYRAYENLPQALRDRIGGLKALQIRERVYDRPNRLTDLQAGDICTVHDVVRSNPETGRKYIFVNQAWTDQIIGLSESESRGLMEELFGYLYAADGVYEHKWTDGDLVLWDNLALQHSRGLAGEGERTLQRVTITEMGYAQQYPTDVKIYDELHNDSMLEAESC